MTERERARAVASMPLAEVKSTFMNDLPDWFQLEP
jgi:hypothetical protein